MKKLLIVASFLFISALSKAEDCIDSAIVQQSLCLDECDNFQLISATVTPGDTIIKKTVKPDKIEVAGDLLLRSGKSFFTGLGFVLVGGIIVGVGALVEAPAVIILGGVVCVIGNICHIDAWSKIKKAGIALKQKNLDK